MSEPQYVIELESVKPGLLVLMNQNQSHVHLDMAPAAPGRASRIVITSEQFNVLAYDIEAHASGTRGCPQDLKIWLRDLSTKESEQVDFASADFVVNQAKAIADEAAAELQAKQDAEVAAARATRLKEKQDAAAAAGGSGLAPGFEAALGALTET